MGPLPWSYECGLRPRPRSMASEPAFLTRPSNDAVEFERPRMVFPHGERMSPRTEPALEGQSIRDFQRPGWGSPLYHLSVV